MSSYFNEGQFPYESVFVISELSRIWNIKLIGREEEDNLFTVHLKIPSENNDSETINEIVTYIEEHNQHHYVVEEPFEQYDGYYIINYVLHYDKEIEVHTQKED